SFEQRGCGGGRICAASFHLRDFNETAVVPPPRENEALDASHVRRRPSEQFIAERSQKSMICAAHATFVCFGIPPVGTAERLQRGRYFIRKTFCVACEGLQIPDQLNGHYRIEPAHKVNQTVLLFGGGGAFQIRGYVLTAGVVQRIQ